VLVGALIVSPPANSPLILFKTITQYKGCYVKYWEFNIHLCFSCKRYLYSNKGENIKNGIANIYANISFNIVGKMRNNILKIISITL